MKLEQGVFMAGYTFRIVEKVLLANGFRCVRIKGSHHHYKKSGYKGTVTVPCHNGDISAGVLNSIERQASLIIAA